MINPQLYQALCQLFGQRNVRVVKQGMKGNFKLGLRTRVVGGHTEDYRTICKQDIHNSVVGEEFRVPCPFCRDHLQRLYINHLWASKDNVTGSRYLWLANCYNEGCLSSFERRKELLSMVLSKTELDRPLREGYDPPTDLKANWPGEVWPIYDMAKQDPKHPAVQFAFGRMWDIEELSRLYDVRVVLSSRYWPNVMQDRIIAPVYSAERELKTWTARTTNLPTPDENGKLSMHGIAKWLHCPYIGTGSSVYGLGSARKHKVPIVVEGPADVWPLRGRGAGVFGKTLQAVKAKRIAKVCTEATAIALCLDPDQDARAIIEGREHHLLEAYRTMVEYAKCPVIQVWLPKTTDPGGLDYDITDYHIRRCADEQKIAI